MGSRHGQEGDQLALIRTHQIKIAGAGLLLALGLVIAACSPSAGDPESTIPAVPEDDAGASEPPVGTFAPPGTSSPDGGSATSGCKPTTCAAASATCGPIGDGCGKIIQCGSCSAGETCGGGGVPSHCGKPACAKKTCADLGAECGAAGDGCGGLLASCGTCDAGICGGGGPSKCGLGTSDGGADGGVCVPTKASCAAGDCGPIADGCGGLLDCGAACPGGQTCGGGGVASQCGAPPCVKTTCGAQNCGVVADGCGGIVSCWPSPAVCPPGQSCGGSGTANTCGTPPSCTGLCLQQQMCPGGGTTSIEGYVTTPNGLLPVPNAVVYVPNGAVAPFGANVTCDTCATPSGNPLVSTTTDANGHFYLPNMPVSTGGAVTNIPLVVQLGRWRKQLTIATTACSNTLVPVASSALPHNRLEGDIPLTAISTGQVDALECVFRKIGIDDSEFADGNGAAYDLGTSQNVSRAGARIRLYPDNGAIVSARHCSLGLTVSCSNAACGSKGGTCVYPPNADALAAPCTGAGCTNEIDKFDQVIFGCVGYHDSKSAPAQQNVIDYANKGGRVFGTHYSYVWLYDSTPWSGTASWLGGLPGSATDWNGTIQAFLDTSFPKGQLFSNWLQAPTGPVSATFAPPYPDVSGLYTTAPPSIQIAEGRRNIAGTPGVTSPAQRWLYTTAASELGDPANDPAADDAVMHYTFNTDWTKPAAAQCGRVVYSDFHVTVGNTNNVVFPNECGVGLSSQEKVLAYMLFDLASCVASAPPAACVPKTCASQGLGCGLGGDGCGGTLDCGPCAQGTCGGGGVPSQCGAPSCVPQTCAAGACGRAGDGCGGTLDCGSCAQGACGGGGTPNVCGIGVCNPTACPAPGDGTACGPVANGCGGVNECACAANVPCVNGACGAPACTPLTCAKVGANCGTVADGCGSTIACGSCVAPQTCGGGGVTAVCGGGVN